jgi:hypothetical protein
MVDCTHSLSLPATDEIVPAFFLAARLSAEDRGPLTVILTRQRSQLLNWGIGLLGALTGGRLWVAGEWEEGAPVAFEEVWAMQQDRRSVLQFAAFQPDLLPNLGLAQVCG